MGAAAGGGGGDGGGMVGFWYGRRLLSLILFAWVVAGWWLKMLSSGLILCVWFVLYVVVRIVYIYDSCS